MGGETVPPTAAYTFESHAQGRIFAERGIALAAVATERLDFLIETVGFGMVQNHAVALFQNSHVCPHLGHFT